MRWNYLLVCCLAAFGCSRRPGAIRAPRLDPDQAAATALERYDTNDDGSLDQPELAGCPSLRHVLDRYDTSGDGQLDVEEISRGMDAWASGNIGATAVPFQVKLNGTPLTGAVVKLIPAEFLGDAVKPARGQSTQGGRGALGMSEEHLPRNAPRIPLVQPGLYRVEITHATRNIPERYNTNTTIGAEVSRQHPGPSGITWDLRGK